MGVLLHTLTIVKEEWTEPKINRLANLPLDVILKLPVETGIMEGRCHFNN